MVVLYRSSWSPHVTVSLSQGWNVEHCRVGVVLGAGTAFLTGASSLTYLSSEDWTLESIWLLSPPITSVPSFLTPVLLFKLFVLMVAVYLKLTLLTAANMEL